MIRRLALAWVLLALLGSTTQAQIPFARDLLPTRSSLERLGMERHWYAIVPLGVVNERVISMNLDENLLFAQTNLANLYAFEAETGRMLWGANLGPPTGQAQPASANSNSVFATNGSTLYALDRRTGRPLWVQDLALSSMSGSGFGRLNQTNFATSATACNEDVAAVGLSSGKLVAFHLKDLSTPQNPGPKPGSFAFAWMSNQSITSRPIVTEKIVAFGSQDGKVYVARQSPNALIYRFLTGGAISAPLGSYGNRTLLVPSYDFNVYAIDLFNGEVKWTFPSGAPVSQEPLVSGKDVYVENAQGALSALNAETGEVRWTHATGEANLLAIGEKRVFLRSADRDLIIVERTSGTVLAGARETAQRAGLNLREFVLAPANDQNDRLYFATPSGFLLCIRELNRLAPHPLRDPKATIFGKVEPAGNAPTPPTPPTAQPPAEEPQPEPAAPTDETKPAEEKATPPAGGNEPPAAEEPAAPEPK